MTKGFKPDGYNSASPYLIVDAASTTIDFLTRVFGATEIRRFAGPDGRLRHAEVRIDDTVIMVADSVDGWPAVPANVHVYVPDVDATYKRAIDAGAKSIQEPAKKDDADRRSGVKDSNGTSWWIATKID